MIMSYLLMVMSYLLMGMCRICDGSDRYGRLVGNHDNYAGADDDDVASDDDMMLVVDFFTSLSIEKLRRFAVLEVVRSIAPLDLLLPCSRRILVRALAWA